MNVQLLIVPYDSAHRGVRMGAGPEALVASGLASELTRKGHSVAVAMVEPLPNSWRAEIQTAFDLARLLAKRVREARSDGRFPVVLAGNCGVSVGVVGGLSAERTGVLWFDAHGDFNTPETTVGGFLDGMALATLTGRCWRELARSVPGFVPVPDGRIALIGARDLDVLEKEALSRSGIAQVSVATARSGLGPVLNTLVAEVGQLYVHADLDVLDVSEGRANEFAVPGGLRRGELAALLAEIAAAAPVAALTLSAYDPLGDSSGRLGDTAVALTVELLAGVARRAEAV